MTITQVKALIFENTREKGLLAALGGSLLISFDPIFIRLSGTGGVDTAFLFGLFMAISMAAFIQATGQRGLVGTLRASGWPVVVSGLLIMGSSTAFVVSIKYTSVANTMIIMSARPVLTALASWVFLRERTSKSLWLAIAGVICGVGIVVSGSLGAGNFLGDGLAVMTVSFLALNGALLRRYQHISRMAVVGLGGFFVACVMFFPAQPSSYTLDTWLIMAAMGLVSAPLGRVLSGVSFRYIPAAEAAMISLSSTMLAPLWVFFLFHEQPPTTTLMGGALVLGTIATYVSMFRKRACESSARTKCEES